MLRHSLTLTEIGVHGKSFKKCSLFSLSEEVSLNFRSNIETPCVDREDPATLIECGGGVRIRYRSCTNPTPHGSGKFCEGSNNQTVTCNEHACQLPGDFLW